LASSFYVGENPKKNLVVASVKNGTWVLSVDQAGAVHTLAKFVTEPKADLSQNTAVFNHDYTLVAAGGESGVVSVWKKSEIGDLWTRQRQFFGHSKAVYAIDLAKAHATLASSSTDGTCLIFNLSCSYPLRRLSFAEHASAPDLMIKGCRFSPRGDRLYTLNTSQRGASYVTAWNVAGGYHPVTSIQVHSKSSCKMEVGLKSGRIGVGTPDGIVKVVDFNR
jgi:WD40 repeat protein